MAAPPPPPKPPQSKSTSSGQRVTLQEHINEIEEKSKWKERKSDSNGFNYKPSHSLGSLSIFVLEKEQHERHFDLWANILSDEFSIQQIDTGDILKGTFTISDNFIRENLHNLMLLFSQEEVFLK